MKKILFLSLLFISCHSNKNDHGKIELRKSDCGVPREAKKYFLLNTSKKDNYQFTVKCIKDSSGTKQYSFEKIVLKPGAEKELGCSIYYVKDSTISKEIKGNTTFSVSVAKQYLQEFKITNEQKIGGFASMSEKFN